MANDQDYPANADVIQGARAIRSNPALFAALMSPPPAAASADPNAGLAPPRASRQSVPQSSRALATAMASVPTPMPPIRPTDLEAITALASPPPGASAPMDPSIAARAATSSPSPQSVPIDPSIAARGSVMANPPPAPTAAVYATDPGAAQRASLYRQLNPTGSPIGVAPSAMANPPPRSAPSPQTGWQSAPVVGAAGGPKLVPMEGNPYAQYAQPAATGGWQSAPVVPAKPNFFDDPQQRTGSWQPPATDRVANFFDDPQAAKGGYGRDPVVGVPTDEQPAMVDEYGNPTMANLKAIPGAIGDAFANARSGATLGFDDKLAALADTYLPAWASHGAASSSDYAANLAAERAASQATMDRAGPIAGNVEQMAGTLLPGGAIAKGVGAAVKGVPLIGSALGQGGLTGAIIGGGSAAGNDQDVGTGALYGAGAGTAGVPLGWVAGKVAGGVANKIANSAFDKTNGAGLTSSAADKLSEALASQGQTPAQAVVAAQAMGPGATLADTGSATQNLTSRLAAQEPAVAPVIAENLKARAEQLAPRINSVVDQAIGPDFSAPEKLAGLKVATRLNGSAYGPILNSGATVDVTPVRDMIAQTRVDPILAGVEEDPISAALGKAQKYIVGSNPSALPINVAHQAQSAIGDMADSAARSGNMAQARALAGVRNTLLDQMPDAYNAARTQYATDKSIEEAFRDGRSLFAPRSDGQVFDPDLLQQRLSGMSQPEQAAYRMGARKAVSDVMGTARSDPAGLQTKLSNENGYAVNKLRAVFGDEPTSAILDELDKQKGLQATNNLALGGSKTAMASSADDFMPTAEVMGGGSAGGHGFLSSLPPWAVGIGGGALAGRELGEVIGQPHLGMALGAAGGAVRSVAASFINAGRTAAQATDRMAQAKALTGSPNQALSDALMRRAATRPTTVGPNASAAMNAVARAAAARAPSLLANPPSNGPQ